MLPELTNRMTDDWNSLFPEVGKPKSINYLCIPGSVEGGSTTFLAFTDKNSKPAFVAKIHRDRESQDRVFNERDVLNFLEKNGGKLSSSVPRLILCEQISNRWVLVQSIIEGRPMHAVMDNDGRPGLSSTVENMHIAANWLAQLHAITRDNIADASKLINKQINTIEEFSGLFDLSEIEKDYLNKIAVNLSVGLGDRTFVQHGDFCRHNLLITRTSNGMKVGVIDWSDSKPAGLPLYDLFFFLATYYLQVRKHKGIKGFIRAFEDTFLNRNPYSKVVKACIIEHCRKIGQVDFSAIESLFAMFLMERAVFEYHQVLRCSKFGGLPRFTVYLAGLENLDYKQAMKAQIWFPFFKEFVKRKGEFFV